MQREKVIFNVRQESEAGWFIGGLVFYPDNADCWDHDSMYYPTEDALKRDYPTSLGAEEAIAIARTRRWTTM